MDKTTRISRTELAILNCLWDSDGATIRELTDQVYPDGTPTNYATVQKLLDRLEEKGVVRRDRSSRAHRFRAIVSQEQYIGGRLQALADSVCGGSFTPLLTQLVRGKRLKKGDLDELQALLGKLSSRRKKP